MTNDTDKFVDRVLKGLKNTEPSAGLEQRILAAMREKQSLKATARPRTWSFALAGAASLCLVISIAHRRQPMPSTAPHADFAVAVAPSRIETAVPHVAGVAKRPHPLRQAHLRERQAESAAVRKMLATSFPAPPMPLTEQERLLIRLAHKGDPVELAMLDPAQRAERNERERAEFQRFFDPPTTGETK